MTVEENMKLPDYDNIVLLAIEEMKIKFKNYGNEWLELNDAYWKKRIFNEVAEYRDSMTIESEKRKLLNILNMVAMAYATCDIKRSTKYISNQCPNCVRPLSAHIVVRNEFNCDA